MTEEQKKAVVVLTREEQKKALIIALQKNRGHIANACQVVGVTRQTYYNWKKEDEAFREAVTDNEEAVIDLVESKLMQNILKGDVTSIIFYLKTKGRARGYQEKQEIDISALHLPQIELQDCDHEEIEKNFDLLEE